MENDDPLDSGNDQKTAEYHVDEGKREDKSR
jgi:hypothetical protein